MTIDEARRIAEDPQAEPLELRAALKFALAEHDRHEAHAREAERLRTLGGIPPRLQVTWTNEWVVEPPSTAANRHMDPPKGRMIRR